MAERRLRPAIDILNACVREELRDYSFGDDEVYWMDSRDLTKEVAFGYFSSSQEYVVIGSERYIGKEAKALRLFGTKGGITRNDSGPRQSVDVDGSESAF